MTGSSAVLVAGDPDRKVCIICSTKANGDGLRSHRWDLRFGLGNPAGGGDAIVIKSLPAQSAMTQIGTNGQKLTLFVGKH